MGGSAFTNVSTPRMPAETYAIIKNRIHKTLQKYFVHVATPIEAAGKKDYGDIDVMVCEPTEAATPLKETGSQLWQYSMKAVGDLIGATNSKRVGKTDSFNFVVPWPEHLNPPEVIQPTQSDDVLRPSATHKQATHHVQVDIEICHTMEDFNWHKFLHTHGDFWNIIGHMLRKFSITATDQGLFLVIPEVAGQHKTLSRVFATRDPIVAMAYLGFDEKPFWQPFEKWEDVCDFTASCRFHDPGRNRDRYEQLLTPNDTGTPQNEITSAASSETAISDVLCGLDLSKTDRSRVKKRPMLSYWFDVYRPAHLDDRPGSASQLSKEEALDDAKNFFGPEFAAQYEKQKYEGMKFGFESKLWAETRKFVKSETDDSSEVTLATKGLKRVLLEDPVDADWAEVENLADLRMSYTKLDLEGLMVWWKEKWKTVEARQREFDRIKSAVAFKATKEREAAAKLEKDSAAVVNEDKVDER